MIHRIKGFLAKPVAWGAVLLSYIGIFVGFGFAVFTYQAANSDITNLSRDNRALSCETSKLIAYVPALQFEGEPIENFLGWLRARRSILETVHATGQCGLTTERLLQERVRLDVEALEQLMKER